MERVSVIEEPEMGSLGDKNIDEHAYTSKNGDTVRSDAKNDLMNELDSAEKEDHVNIVGYITEAQQHSTSFNVLCIHIELCYNMSCLSLG